jgi:hypothetical protein
MNDALITVVYVSAATQPMSTPELEALLVHARQHNRQYGLTGVLLYYDGSFIQCLEGPESALLPVYWRICADTRHHGVTELLREPIAQRSFSNWTMGYAQPTRSELLALSTAQWSRMHASASAPAHDALGMVLLQNFWRNARR